MAKEYKLLIEKYIEHLVEDLNNHGQEGWSLILAIPESGVTKVVLEREKVIKNVK